jgi:RNA polymerase sigma factor (sigma-70 family)
VARRTTPPGEMLPEAEREALVRQWGGLPAWVVDRWYTAGLMAAHRDDLVAEGAVGLVIASKRYRPHLGGEARTFNTFAVHWVRQRVRRYVERRLHLIPVPKGRPGRPPRLAPDVLSTDFWRGKGNSTDATQPATDPRDADAARHARELVGPALRFLTAKQKEVVRRRFWLGQTLEETGRAVGLTRERVRQVEKDALTRLRVKLAKHEGDF